MSNITDVILYIDNMSEDLCEQVNSPVDPEDERFQKLSRIDMKDSGGTKYFTQDVYAAALNHISQEIVKKWFLDLVIYEDQRLIIIINNEFSDFPLMLCR